MAKGDGTKKRAATKRKAKPPAPARNVKMVYEVTRDVRVKELDVLLSSKDIDLIKSDATDFLVNGEAFDVSHAWVMAVAMRLSAKVLKKSQDGTGDANE